MKPVRGKVYYWMAGELISHDENDNSDISAVRSNMISITPVTFEITHKSVMKELERMLCDSEGNCGI